VSGFGVDWSYPVRVKGSARGLLWDMARHRAGEDIYRLCAVLSALVDSAWVPKQSAHPLARGDLHIPAAAPYLAEATKQNLEDLERNPVAFPDGLDEAWARAGTEDIAGPLSAHYRGLMLEEMDPTTAMTLFVAAVEGVGARDVALERCECGMAQVGARKRFRHALSSVMGEADVSRLMKMYDVRSSAAHGDLITGQPLTTDRLARVGWFYTSDEHDLRGHVWDMRQASRMVVTNALTGPRAQDA
jgi:hypothetical protein